MSTHDADPGLGRHPAHHPVPTIVPALVPRYIGVRCACGAYVAFGEEGDPRCWRRLDQPSWIVCPGCQLEQQYGRNDVQAFSWPPEPAARY